MIIGIILAIAVAGGAAAFYIFSNGMVRVDARLKSPSIHSFRVAGLDGREIDFASFKGRKILVVNTASRCGLTPQYEGLERLYRKYGDRLVIVGFPTNDFLFQEPGKNDEIAAFCQKNYGVSFPMAAKIAVKGGNQAPVYQWLTNKALNGVASSAVSWNFQKYILDEEGRLIRHFSPNTDPEDAEVIRVIEGS